MHRTGTPFKVGEETRDITSTTTNLWTRKTKSTSYSEKESTPASTSLKKASNNPFFAHFTNKVSRMESSDVMDEEGHTLTALGSPCCSTGPPPLPPLSFVVTPPDTPTFEANISQPVPIPCIAPSASCLMTPPDTPTSPSGFSMKRKFVQRTLPQAHDVSFFASTMFTPPSSSASKYQVGKEAAVGDDVTGARNQVDEDKNNCKKHRPELRLNTKLRSAMTEYQDFECKEEAMETEIVVKDEEKSVRNGEGVPKIGGDDREPLVLCFVAGSDLRKIADQFQATYGKTGRIVETWSLNFTISTALNGYLSVSTFCLNVGESLPEVS